MISSFRNFAKTKFAGLLVFIMIIPFIFWGMGSMFSSGNSNTIAKIDNENISTQDFIDHINNTNIPQQTIKDNLSRNIIEELLSTLISTTLLDLEVKNFDIIITEDTLLRKIKSNKNFKSESGNFERMKYEKFLLENNQSAPMFELKLRGRELQKNLFDYIGAGTVSPKFLTKKLFEEENRKIQLEFIELTKFYKQKKEFTELEIQKFLEENNEQLKVEYLDFDYAIINPEKIIGVNEFNQVFFDKIDAIERDISNNVDLEIILSKLKIKPIKVTNFRMSSDKKDIEKKIYESRNFIFDIIENNNDYIIYKINKSEERSPNLDDPELKKEIINLIYQKNKFDYNRNLIKQINEKKFDDKDFVKLGKDKIQSLFLNSIKDNNKFEINAVELLYSLPTDSFTLINDEEKNIYLAKIKNTQEQTININDDNFQEYSEKQKTNIKKNILRSYDLLLNKKYNVVLNQKTIERVKNFFQ